MRGGGVQIWMPAGAGPVRAAGVVVYTNVPGNLHRDNLPVGMGVRFTDLAEPAGAAIRRLVAETALALAI